MVTTREIKQVISESLNIENLEEAYVSTPKQFKIATELLSKKTKDLHMKLYQGYIDKLNRASAELDTVDRASADSRASAYRTLKEAEVYNRNAVYLHELYFANISDTRSEIAYDSIAYMKLSRDFGTFDDWQWDIIACALSARNGWAVTAYDTFLKRYNNFFIDGFNCSIPVGCYPVLVIDMFEHSYILDYADNKKQYVMNMMRELNWSVIERRIQRSEKIAGALL